MRQFLSHSVSMKQSSTRLYSPLELFRAKVWLLVLDVVPVARRRERVRAARPLLQLRQLVRGGHVRLVQLEPALVPRPARRQAVITKIAREARPRDRRLLA